MSTFGMVWTVGINVVFGGAEVIIFVGTAIHEIKYDTR